MSKTARQKPEAGPPKSAFVSLLGRMVVPLLSILTAFVIGGIVIALASEPDAPLLERFGLAVRGYAALVDGAFFKKLALADTLVATTPLLLTGLAVALGFRAGLFNIGGEGQYLMGAVFAVYIGYALQLPAVIHAVAAFLAGAVGGTLWAFVPGFLKARLGAHEVITTIMMNYIAYLLQDWLVNNPMKDPSGPSVIRTPFIHETANIPRLNELIPADVAARWVEATNSQFLRDFFSNANRLHLGFFLAVLIAVGVWWLMWKTTIGFELRTSGANLNAARYAGVRSARTIILAMVLSGSLAGMAGAIEVQGLNRSMPAFFQSGYGFDAIAVALLGQNHPFAIIPSALLFGALNTGSAVLQIRTGVSSHMVSIIQALILLFVAAPAMVRWLYRLRAQRE